MLEGVGITHITQYLNSLPCRALSPCLLWRERSDLNPQTDVLFGMCCHYIIDLTLRQTICDWNKPKSWCHVLTLVSCVVLPEKHFEIMQYVAHRKDTFVTAVKFVKVKVC